MVPIAGVGLKTLPSAEIQRSGAIRGSTPVDLDVFPGSSWGGGSLVLLSSYELNFGHLRYIFYIFDFLRPTPKITMCPPNVP